MTKADQVEHYKGTFPIPAHVPLDRVADLNFANGNIPNDYPDPYIETDRLRDPDVPRILYNPDPASGRQCGAWAVSHYDDIRRVYEDNEHFSTKGAAEFQSMVGETFRSIPLAIDPPEHGKYRRFLNPHFTPVAMKAMEPKIRAVVVEMIEQIADSGEVDIAYGFGRVYPVRIFLDLMGLPFAMFEQFLEWEYEILHSKDYARIGAAVTAVIAYLRGFIAEKEANPDDRLGSYIVHGDIEGQPLNADEKLGIIWFLWLGGLDTVASTISQMFRRLVLDTELQERIRANPQIIPSAVEEFLRTQPLVNSARVVRKDFTWHGVELKAGDVIQCIVTSGNFDPAAFKCPRTFDPERPANRHYTFVGGSHICLGAHLARRELRVLLEEWFARIPPFRLKPGADTTVTPGLLSIRNLPLVWDHDSL